MVANDKLFGCPYCGFRISPDEKLCTRCGNKFGPGTKFECPFCGDLVAPDMKECPSCHVDFHEFQTRVRKIAKKDSVDSLLMEIIRLEATEVARENKRLSCPNCDLLLDGSELSCPRCKKDLTAGTAFQCPVCGEFVAPEAMKCPACDASFEVRKAESIARPSDFDHEALSSTLDDILASAGHDGSHSEPEDESKASRPAEFAEPDEIEPPPPPDYVPEPEPKASTEESQSGIAPRTIVRKPKVRKLKTNNAGTEGEKKAGP